MLDQAKIDLAVLWKLFQHSENGGEPDPPREIAHLFGANISLKRVEIALEALEGRREVDRVYHAHYSDEGLWQISREGVRTVEKALKLPNSLIARLAANGDQWLESEEAEAATLSKNLRYEEPKSPESVASKPPPSEQPDAKVHVNIAPVFNNNAGMSGDEHQLSAKRAGWFGAWGGWASAAIGLAGLLWILHEAKVF